MKISIHEAYSDFDSGFQFEGSDWDSFLDEDDDFESWSDFGKTLSEFIAKSNTNNWVISFRPDSEGEVIERRWDYALIERMLKDQSFDAKNPNWLIDFFYLMHHADHADMEGCAVIAWCLDRGDSYVEAAQGRDGYVIRGAYNDKERAIKVAGEMLLDYNDVPSWMWPYVDKESMVNDDDYTFVFHYADGYYALHTG